MADTVWEEISHRNQSTRPVGKFFPRLREREEPMYKTEPTDDRRLPVRRDALCAVRSPESTVCHCRMCQKAVGGPFAALSKVKTASFAWTGRASQLPKLIGRRTAFLRGLRHPADLPFLDGDAIEVTTGSLDNPAAVPITKNFGTEYACPGSTCCTPASCRTAAPRSQYRHARRSSAVSIPITRPDQLSTCPTCPCQRDPALL